MWRVLKPKIQFHLVLSLPMHAVLFNYLVLRYMDNFTKCSVVVSSPVCTGYPGFESCPGNCLSSLWFSFKLLQKKKLYLETAHNHFIAYSLTLALITILSFSITQPTHKVEEVQKNVNIFSTSYISYTTCCQCMMGGG